jgi:hypothetical protein
MTRNSSSAAAARDKRNQAESGEQKSIDIRFRNGRYRSDYEVESIGNRPAGFVHPQ